MQTSSCYKALQHCRQDLEDFKLSQTEKLDKWHRGDRNILQYSLENLREIKSENVHNTDNNKNIQTYEIDTFPKYVDIKYTCRIRSMNN